MKALLLSLCVLICAAAVAQPGIQWQKSLGGTQFDYPGALIATSDGGYFFAGSTNSINGDITANKGGYDGWIVKLNASGTIQWQKTLGGSLDDYLNAAAKTADGGYILAGSSKSNDGGITGNQGDADYWVVKITATGNVQWQKTFGGSNYDVATTINQTPDGGYIVAGSVLSTDGDAVGNHGFYDALVVKLTSTGTAQWKKVLGGNNSDGINDIKPLPDGSLVCAGSTNVGAKGNEAWILKLRSSGTTQWQKTFGGSSSEGLNSIDATSDGYIMAGGTSSNDRDVSGHHGAVNTNSDGWVIKTDTLGNMQWQKCIGGSANDYIMRIKQVSKGNYIIAATSSSNDGDVSGNHGKEDYWVVKMGHTGNLIWQKAMGGSGAFNEPYGDDEAVDIVQSSDSGYVVAGRSSSLNGDITGHHGNASLDVWVVRLKTDTSLLASQIITFPDLPVKYINSADFALTATTNSGLPVTYTSSDTTVASITAGNIVHIKKTGTINITATQSGNIDYAEAEPVTRFLTITKAPQYINFPTIPPRNYGSPDFAFGANASSGLPVTYTSSDTNVISIVGDNKGHIKKVGSVTIKASQAGNGVYTAASTITNIASVTKAGQTITFPNIGNHNVLQGFVKLNATASSGLPVTYTSNDISIVQISNDTAFFKKEGNVVIGAVQNGNENYNAATTIANNVQVYGVYTSVPYTTICPNTPLTFTASVSLAPAGIKYQWRKNKVNVGTNSTTYTDSTLQNNDSVQLIISANGRSYSSKVYRMFVQAPRVTISAPYTQVCPGGALIFTASISVPTGVNQISWIKNNIAVIPTGVTYIDQSPQNGDSVWCVIRTSAACAASTPGLVSNKIRPKVLSNGVVSVSINYQPSNYKLCQAGDTTTLTFHAVGQNGGSNPQFAWQKNGIGIPNSDTSFYTLHGLKAGDKISCYYSSNQTCTLNGIKTVQSNIVTLATNTPLTPALTIAQNPTGPVCHGDSVRFKVSSIYGSGSAPIYQWMKNNVKVGTNSDVYYDNDLLIGDSVWCTMKTDYPCAVSPVAASNKIKPVVNYNTPLIPSAINGPATVKANQKDVGYLVNRVNDVTYLWSVPAGATIRSGLHINEALINWGTTGGTLVVQARNGCGYSERSRLVVTVTPSLQSADGFEEQSTISGIASSKAQLYPNPAIANTTVSFTAVEAGKYLVQVVDAQGRILQVKETNAAKGHNTIPINVSGYAKGSYFVRLTNKDGKQQATFTLVVGGGSNLNNQ